MYCHTLTQGVASVLSPPGTDELAELSAVSGLGSKSKREEKVPASLSPPPPAISPCYLPLISALCDVASQERQQAFFQRHALVSERMKSVLEREIPLAEPILASDAAAKFPCRRRSLLFSGSKWLGEVRRSRTSRQRAVSPHMCQQRATFLIWQVPVLRRALAARAALPPCRAVGFYRGRRCRDLRLRGTNPGASTPNLAITH